MDCMKNKNIQRYFSSLTHFSTVFEKTKYLSKVVAKFTFLQILTNGKLHNIIDILHTKLEQSSNVRQNLKQS